MLTRVYIDNYKSLVNFEFKPGPIQLILGDNGSGKSSFFEAISRLRQFLVNGSATWYDFLPMTMTRWDHRPRQTFELTVERENRPYVYRVELEQSQDRDAAEVALETLLFDGKPLFTFTQGQVQRYRDDHTEGPNYSSNQQQSALFSVPSDGDNKSLAWFKDWMRSLYLAAVEPEILSYSIDEASEPDTGLTNFISWYRYLKRTMPGAVEEFHNALKAGVVGGFESLELERSGGREWRLSIGLESRTGRDGTAVSLFECSELSAGQRVLIKLYALAYCAMKPGSTLILDDPVVHVSLREIQPWLTTLLDRADDIKAQVLLISHHPELINYLARERGVFFDREGNGPVRVRPAHFDEDEPLSPAELVARGWTDG